MEVKKEEELKVIKISGILDLLNDSSTIDESSEDLNDCRTICPKIER